jgi:hypothetical protein
VTSGDFVVTPRGPRAAELLVRSASAWREIDRDAVASDLASANVPRSAVDAVDDAIAHDPPSKDLPLWFVLTEAGEVLEYFSSCKPTWEQLTGGAR